MLKQRIITAIVLIAITLLALFFLPSGFMFMFIAAIIGITAYEWANMLQMFKIDNGVTNNKLYNKWGYVFVIVLFFFASASVFKSASGFLISISALIWIALFVLLFTKMITEKVKCVAGLIVLPVAGLSLWQLFLVSPYWMLAACLVVWIADTAAYFSGKKFGKRKLAPTISPGKTIEGFYGAVAAVSLYALVLYIFSDKMTMGSGFVFWMMSFALMTAISVLGDLFESQLKRDASIKDSGRILPGHGGVFDRIDSLIAVAPFFALLVI